MTPDRIPLINEGIQLSLLYDKEKPYANLDADIEFREERFDTLARKYVGEIIGPQLGLATTGQLFDELRARIEVMDTI